MKGFEMVRSFALQALILLVQAAAAREINVADFGVVPGKDATFALNRLIESVRDEPGVTLVFPKGQYEFYPENAVERYRAVSNHDNSLKRIAFPLLGCKDITIDGGGSLFLFHGRISPLVLDGVDGATLKNFSIDWSRSFHDELPIVARDEAEGSITVEVDPQRYPHSISFGQLFSEKYNWQDRMGSNIVFDPKTRSPIYRTSDYGINFGRPYEASWAGENRIKIVAAFRKVPPPVGSVLISYGTHPTSRLCPAIHVANSRDLTIQDVTVYEAGGMGLIVERTENAHLDHYVVTSNSERLVSTRADATHFIGCKGTILVEHCLFEHMLDDSINVHGAYVKVEKYLGNREFLCEISHFQQWGLTFAEPGDEVALLSRETILPFHHSIVEKVRVLNERRFVMTLAKVPDELPDEPLSVENLTWYPDLIMRNNVVRENRARSVLVTTKGKVLIENNYFSSQMHGILIEGDNNWWYESGAVQDVTIRNNVFENVGYEVTRRYPLFASPLYTAEQRMGEGQYHRNINFTGNTVRSFNGLLAHVRSVAELNISDNTIEFSTDYPAADEGPAIVMTYCDGVTIQGNQAKGFARPLRITRSADTTSVKVGENPGFK